MDAVSDTVLVTSAEEDPSRHAWVGTIVTYTGTEFDIVNPDPTKVHLGDIAQALSLSCRYNGHIPHFYSIAEHCVRVSWWLRVEGYDAETQLTGLLHDAAEAYVGDMVRPLKRYAPIGTPYQEIEARVEQAICTALGGRFPYPQAVMDADKSIYEWEVGEIRTGHRIGWTPAESKAAFLRRYELLTGGEQLELFPDDREVVHSGAWYTV